MISVKLADPQFEGQTKTKLGNPPIEGLVKEPSTASSASSSRRTRARRSASSASRSTPRGPAQAARKARDLTRRKSRARELDPARASSPTAPSRDPALAELFIVEGDSAGGSAKQGRDRNTQAILPLRGKIINVEKARIDKVLSNNEIQALITAIGTGIREEFDIEDAPLPQGRADDRRRR